MGPPNLLAELQAKKQQQQQQGNPLAQALLNRKAPPKEKEVAVKDFGDAAFLLEEDASVHFAVHQPNAAEALKDAILLSSSPRSIIQVPLAPCVYRMTDRTLAKKEPIPLSQCVHQLGVLRCLARECQILNDLMQKRFQMPSLPDGPLPSLEEQELGQTRFMELLSKCGVYQKVSELILQAVGKGSAPTIVVHQLDDLLNMIEDQTPSLAIARQEIADTQTVSFFPGLGELFPPGADLVCYPDGTEGTPLGCQVVQCWYDEETNLATQKTKRRFILVVEFIVSVGDALVFVAASDVYPEFHDPTRNTPIKDLTHRRLWSNDDRWKARLQQRGEFYASVATHNHYLEYHPNSFFPIIGGGWKSNAVRPLSKGGRVMVDVKRGILEGHIPVRASDGLSDTVKEAIKLFEQSKRTGVAVPFRTCRLPGFGDNARGLESDRDHLWQAWPILVGFSFTARVWGKLLLGMPKDTSTSEEVSVELSPRRSPVRKLGGVQVAALGGVGSCGNCGYISFQEKAFEQLVLADDKKELIRAVARNAGDGGTSIEDGDEDDDDIMGIDVIANKGGASIFLLHGPPGCGKTLTAEAIAELLQKPLYVVTAGDLGITAAEVEKSLGSVLELCQTWDALVLIDEADIFLEARSSHEIQRNALVCVMLRLLEYYSGCLFLSSNRAASSIDAAIASRITVMLGYPPLDQAGRAKVWKNLAELVPPLPETTPLKPSKYREHFSPADYDSLASSYELNGRQIKNSIVLARALARERGSPLSLDILRRAVTAVAGTQL